MLNEVAAMFNLSNSNEPTEAQIFNYNKLNSETYIFVQQRTSEIKALMRRTAQDIIEIGLKLTEVKEELGHGNFIKWLDTEFGWSGATATRFMQVGNQFKFVKLTNLEIAASALYLLARPSTPEEARQEALERAFQGEVITHTLAKQICFHHTIDVDAETVENDEVTSDLTQASLDQEPLPKHKAVNEPSSSTTGIKIESIPPSNLEPQVTPKPSQASEYLQESPQIELPPVAQFEVGDRICILRRQHGKDNWAGKTARISQITPDGWLRVDVEGHKGVKFTLKPNWVESMPELSPEQHNEQPEPVLDEGWADEPDPELPISSEQSQSNQLASLEKRVRTTLTLNGEAVEVEGVITHVRFEWQHGDCSGDVQVPIDQVKFFG